MRIIISPAKKLNEDNIAAETPFSTPLFLEQSQALIHTLQEKDSYEVAHLMKLSMKLADLNVQRFQQWHTPFTPDNAKQAIYTFAGDVYQGLNAETLSSNDLDFAQQHLRILSGLYGLLRPLDLMQAYRLEMGTKLNTALGHNLYDFWGSTITNQLNNELKSTDSLINLASQEYFKSIQSKHIKCPIITPIFKEHKNGAYKVIGIYAKRARGLMARFIIENRITVATQIKNFAVENYSFNSDLSNETSWVFTRG